jgi:hypothetical protein
MDAWNSGGRGVRYGEQVLASAEGLTRGVEWISADGWQSNEHGVDEGRRVRWRAMEKSVIDLEFDIDIVEYGGC